MAGQFDLVENLILFDGSKPGAVRKVIARNHQVLGVNNAVASVARQEEPKREFPPEKRLAYRVVEVPTEEAVDADLLPVARTIEDTGEKRVLVGEARQEPEGSGRRVIAFGKNPQEESKLS